MDMKPACPCKRISCARHGDCEACRAHHKAAKETSTACERAAARAARRDGRAEMAAEKSKHL